MYHYRGNKPILYTKSCTSFIINFTWNSESAIPLKKWLLMSGLPSGGRAWTTVITPICVFSRTFNHFPILHMASNGHQHHPMLPFSHVWAMIATFFCDCDVYQIGKFGRLHIFISSINSLYHLNLKLHNATMSCDFGKLGLWIDVHSNLKAVSLTSWMSVAVKDM